MPERPVSLADGMRLTELSYTELGLRYLAIGGSGTPDQLRLHLNSNACSDEHEHTMIAQALNDTYVERGRDHPGAYRHLNDADE